MGPGAAEFILSAKDLGISNNNEQVDKERASKCGAVYSKVRERIYGKGENNLVNRTVAFA